MAMSTFDQTVYPKIQTLAFLDLETTGLILPKPHPPPRITELGIVAITRQEFLGCIRPAQNAQIPPFNNGHTEHTNFVHPRVVCKLLQPLNPDTDISNVASKSSYLYQSSLDNMPTFPVFAPVIRSFLANLPSPVCLIAHNGYRFDFPILKTELIRSMIELNQGVLFADSVHLFRQIDTRWLRKYHIYKTAELEEAQRRARWSPMETNEETSGQTIYRPIDQSTTTTTPQKADITDQHQENGDSNARRQLFNGSDSPSTPIYRYRFTEVDGSPITDYVISPAKSNGKEEVVQSNGAQTMSSNGEQTMPSNVDNAMQSNGAQAISSNGEQTIPSNVAQTIPSNGAQPNMFTNMTQFMLQSPLPPAKSKILALADGGKLSYSLKAVHQRIFDGMDPLGHHSAEADCLSILQIAAQYGEDFLNELDKSAKSLVEIKKAEDLFNAS